MLSKKFFLGAGVADGTGSQGYLAGPGSHMGDKQKDNIKPIMQQTDV